MRLRRSFSCDFVNEDSSTNFLPGEGNDPSDNHNHPSGNHVSSQVTITHSVPLTGLSPTTSDSKGLSPFHLGHGLTLNSSPSSTGTLTHSLAGWQSDVDDALAADFDGSLSGLGMEANNPYNMSDALSALPSVKHEHFGNVHCSHKSSHHREPHYEPPQEHEVRPVAIVHGKKNRLAHGHDDEEASMTSGIKRVCISNERDTSTQDSSRFADQSSMSQLHTTNSNSRDSYESMVECNQEDCDHSLSRCNKHSNSAPDLRPVHHPHLHSHNSHDHSHHSTDSSPSPSLSTSLVLPQHQNGESPPSSSLTVNLSGGEGLGRKFIFPFEYTLQAATSVATKIHEETMTYLNQGQSYEIKLKKLPSVASLKRVRSIVRVGFYERRLQFQERELIDQWRGQRHLERILEIDIPLSYGVTDVTNDPIDINRCSFSWDANREAGIFIKVNCISTEFTPKKHGGEKGVPFRIIIETHAFVSPNTRPPFETILHAASTQVKVFKPKGADRKHKTDREKLSKRGGQMDNFRPAYDVTKFMDFPIAQVYSCIPRQPIPTSTSNGSSTGFGYVSPLNSPSGRRLSQESPADPDGPLDFTSTASSPRKLSIYPTQVLSPSSSPAVGVARKISLSPSRTVTSPPPTTPIVTNGSSPFIIAPSTIRIDSSIADTGRWLSANRFESHAKTFLNFSGSDLFRLARTDLIQLCGEIDGIRLFNCLHHQPRQQARCTIYVRPSSSPDDDFSAVFLESLTEHELKSKLGNLLCTSNAQVNGSSGRRSSDEIVSPSPSLITKIRMKGPHGIPILVTDEYVQNIQQESLFIVDFEKDGNGYRAILKNYSY